MHDPPVARAGDAGVPDLVGTLADPEGRLGAAEALAWALGGERLHLFAPDPEIGVTLPAPGLPQVLQGAAAWSEFLDRCARAGELSGEVPGPDGTLVAAHGCALPDGTAAVLVRPSPGRPGPRPLRPFLPLLGALFRAERRISADQARARSAADAIERARVLTRGLQEMRGRLGDALVVADEARAEARARADHAEALAEELREQSAELQDQAAELEMLNEEMRARTEEAERAREAADEANRAKSSFLANMSHELRTPINAVIGYAEILNLGISGPVTEAQQLQLARIRSSSAHLLTLVDDVLDLAKVEAGKMIVGHQREPVAEVADEALAVVEMQAQSRGITVVNECTDRSAVYVGDRDRVRQVLLNLLSNAIKFTAPGGRITLRGGSTALPQPSVHLVGEGPWTWIAVEDTGTGVAPEELPRLFQPFVQAETGHTRRHDGTGLGLTISRQLARLMGGDLVAESEEGKGSRFTLWLPAASPETGELDPTIMVGAASLGAGKERAR